MLRMIALLILCLTVYTCGSTNQDETPTGETRAAIEARLILELAPEDSREGRERNQLINYAIDQVWDVTPSSVGYFYQLTKAGSGADLEYGDYVEAHYRGSLLDGTLFADSRQQGRPMNFYVGQMIPAWNDVLQQVPPGASLRLLVPSGLAYGADGLVSSGGDTLIPPYTPLVFEIEQLEVIQRYIDR
ncbi:MAG: FKBP-type peptidyl-prolyl cis-trans isomerase [Bacteroidota bacterium]